MNFIIIIIFVIIFALMPIANVFADDYEVLAKKITQFSRDLDDAGAAEIYASVKKPSNYLEILNNLKVIGENNLLNHQDFYSQENLNKFLAYENIKITCFSNKYCLYSENKITNQGEILINHDLPKEAKISIYPPSSKITNYDDIIKVFGDNFAVFQQTGIDTSAEYIKQAGHFKYRESLEEPIDLAKKSLHKDTKLAYVFSDNKTFRNALMISVSSDKKISNISLYKIKIDKGYSK